MARHSPLSPSEDLTVPSTSLSHPAIDAVLSTAASLLGMEVVFIGGLTQDSFTFERAHASDNLGWDIPPQGAVLEPAGALCPPLAGGAPPAAAGRGHPPVFTRWCAPPPLGRRP